ncbi:MAG: SIR2 family NAD-dependent protein deacylase, partial [Anaerolineales bacterium]
TGAGISTPSGVPDFRSASGLWQTVDPWQVASQDAFRHHPDCFYDWVRPLAGAILQARPNAAHHSLAALEREGHLSGVITQNIDSLHRRAGSRVVCEIHGDLRRAACVRCFARVEAEARIQEFVASGEIPLCSRCGGMLKPDVVLFGEALPRQAVELAETLLAGADLVLIVGSSLEVFPAAGLPLPALEAGARLIILNQEATYLDERAEVVLRGDAACLLPEITAKVLDARA